MASVRGSKDGGISLQGAKYDPTTRLLTYSAHVLPFNPARRPVMKPYMNGAPTQCHRCQQPFKVVDRHVEAWRGSDGHLYCGEHCEDLVEVKRRAN